MMSSQLKPTADFFFLFLNPQCNRVAIQQHISIYKEMDSRCKDGAD